MAETEANVTEPFTSLLRRSDVEWFRETSKANGLVQWRFFASLRDLYESRAVVEGKPDGDKT